MKQVKREQAGLLWRLFPGSVRRKVAPHLTRRELEELNESYVQYKKQPPARRIAVQRELADSLRTGRSIWPAALSVLVILGSAALWFFQSSRSMPEPLRLMLFAPLAMTSAAPLSLYLIAPYRLRILFRPPPHPESYAMAVIASIFLVWLIFLIGEGQGGVVRIDRLTFAILLLGAIGAPLLEEVLFRELLPSIGPDPLLGHALSVIVFALAHFPDSPEMFVLYVLSGGFLAALRIESGGLALPVAAHMLANGVVTAARFW